MIKFLTPFFFFLSLGITAQNIKDSCISAPVFSFSYGHQFPFGDLQNRFGSNNNVGFSGGYKLKSNWLFEFSTDFIFGTNVKDTTIVDHLQNNQNWIINQLGEEGIILIQQRGQVFSFKAGKVFDIIGPNQNSGLIFKLGAGWLRHKIRVDNQYNRIPQLSQENLVFYDRLTSGLQLSQFIGYQHMSNNRLTNFYFGFDFLQGFTKGRRDYQIDLMGPANEKRIDLLWGIKFGWIVPVFRQAPNDFYLN
tara:strand:+ start:1003 stop:1749 length:747 start_codon:yes stop_codon:yes gene_type:complete